MIYLLIFTVAGFIVVMAWCGWLHAHFQKEVDDLYQNQCIVMNGIEKLENNLSQEQTLSELLSKWDEAYANSDKQQRRMMTINRQRYGIKTAAEMHGVI